jgi:translocation and assembly module TamB
MARLFRAIGWLVLGALALAGVALSGAALFAWTPGGREIVARAVVRWLDAQVAGSLQLSGVAVLPHGGVEILGLEVVDPEGHRVLSVARARVFLDLTRLRDRAVGVTVELDRPRVDLQRGEDGSLALARAFAPANPTPPKPARAGGKEKRGPGWTIRVDAARIREGEVLSPLTSDTGALAASALGLDARGELGPAGGFVEARLRGHLDAPRAAPLALDLAASLAGERLRVSILDAEVGNDGVRLAGEGDLERRSGRVAVLRLGLVRAGAVSLLPRALPDADLEASGYAESNGAVATAALAVVSTHPEGLDRPARADAAVAVRLPPAALAAGFDVASERLDPRRLFEAAPEGELNGTARGGVRGTSLHDLTARVAVALAPSRLRGGTLGPVDLQASARGGTVEVAKLDARAPGGRVSGSGRWTDRGPVAAELEADAADLARLGHNLSAVLGVDLPPLQGNARVRAKLSGTAAAPSLSATLDAPALAVASTRADRVHLDADVAGPLRGPSGRFELAAARVVAGATALTGVEARGSLQGGVGNVAASARVAGLGREPLAIGAGGRLSGDGRSLEVARLSVAYPGARFELARPARVVLAGPAVDRLELASGRQRIAIEGGVGRRDALDARVELVDLDLATLPPGVVPPDLHLAGVLSGEARASGTTAHPAVEAKFGVATGAVRGLTGIDVQGTARYDERSRRAEVALGAAHAAGGTLDVRAALPLPLARAPPRETLDVRLRAQGVLLERVLAAAGVDVPAGGALALDLAVTGAVAGPALRASVRLADGWWEDLDALDLAVTAEDPGARGTVRVEASRAGAGLATLDASAPLGLAELLAHPDAALRALRTAPLTAHLVVAAADLAPLAGRLGLPESLRGRLSGEAELGGTLAAPRGRAAFAVAGGAVAGYAGIDAKAGAELGKQSVLLTAEGALGGAPLVRVQASLGVAPEALRSAQALAAAPLTAELLVPQAPFAALSRPGLALAGTVDARLTARGTAGDPQLELQASGSALAVGGKAVGAFTGAARYARGRTEAELTLRPISGEPLQATASLDAPLGVGARTTALAEAPVRLHVVTRGLDLAVVPAILPGVVRTAAGTLSMDVSADGTLARLRPLGTIVVKGGAAAVSSYGEWTDIALDARMAQDGVELRQLSARRGSGRLDASGAIHGPLWEHDRPADVELKATAKGLTLSRVGTELATIDVELRAKGTLARDRLNATVTVPSGTVRLPMQTPRTLQSLETRSDIEIGPRREQKHAAPAAAPGGAAPERAFEATLHLEVPGKFYVKSDRPRVDIELKADVRLEVAAEGAYAEGDVNVVRGMVEPIGGRVFQIQRGRVLFTGGPPSAAELDVESRYENPAAVVTVTVFGRAKSPEFKLSSQPPMDDAAIALLIATGRTDLKPGSGGVDTITGQEAGLAVLGALASTTFRSYVSNKLPLDTVTLDAGSLRAGKYLGDRVYVGYVRRFEANPALGENTDELRLEYQITPRWSFESRYGTQGAGGASVIWSKDY